MPELHYITPILPNLPSIIARGILSHRRAARIDHESIALEEVQAIRENKRIPGGRLLHEYANLYFHARNPMLFRRKAQHESLCVLRIGAEVVDLPGVVIADGNAAGQYTRFWPTPEGLKNIDADLVFAEWWTDPDQIVKWRKTSARCAEVLVPDSVPPQFIRGAYVSTPAAFDALHRCGAALEATIDRHLFFLD